MSPRDDPRDKKFTFVLTDLEKTMLENLAEREQRSASDWVRLAIRRAHTEAFGTFRSPHMIRGTTPAVEAKKKPKK